MRILGLDYGDSRIGVAMSDESGVMAQGLTTLVRRNRQVDLQALAAILETHGIDRIVVGYPLRVDGTEGIQCEKVKRFAGLLERCFHIPVIRWDETFSTKDAEEIMRRVKVKPQKKRELVDRIAAAVILQDYLDNQQLQEKKKGNPDT